MARRVSVDDIRKINEVYYECHSYAETARQTGWSASTVRNYIDHNFSPVLESNIHRFDPNTELPEFTTDDFEGVENFGDLCVLTAEEEKEVEDLWKELTV